MSFWAAAKIRRYREALVVGQLTLGGFETFLPRIQTNGHVAPLFSNYLFVALGDRGEGWTKVSWTPGVLRLITFGERPARVPDREIAALRARTDEHGIIRLPPPPGKRRRIAAGTRVSIIGGPLCGVDAIHTGMTAHDRELVLISILGAQRRVAIDSALVLVR